MIRRRHRRSGLSLLEVLLALAIFLMAIVGLGQLMNFCADRDDLLRTSFSFTIWISTSNSSMVM